MRYQPQEHSICVNSNLIDKHLDSQDKQDAEFEYVYSKAVYLFRDQLEANPSQEDINDDLVFEVQYIIDNDSWDVDLESVIKQIYSDFNIKVAE